MFRIVTTISNRTGREFTRCITPARLGLSALRCLSTVPPPVPETGHTVVTESAAVPPPVVPEVTSSGVPLVPESSTEIVDTVARVIPELGNSPSDLIVKCLEHTHVFFDLPYWGAIATFTIILRFRGYLSEKWA